MIDSLDSMDLKSYDGAGALALKERIEDTMKKVDYVLMLTSYRPYQIASVFKDLFNSKSAIFCYRVRTEKGKFLEHQIEEELLNELKAVKASLNMEE